MPTPHASTVALSQLSGPAREDVRPCRAHPPPPGSGGGALPKHAPPPGSPPISSLIGADHAGSAAPIRAARTADGAIVVGMKGRYIALVAVGCALAVLALGTGIAWFVLHTRVRMWFWDQVAA